jgi:hypothetical protein
MHAFSVRPAAHHRRSRCTPTARRAVAALRELPAAAPAFKKGKEFREVATRASLMRHGGLRTQSSRELTAVFVIQTKPRNGLHARIVR